MGFLVGLYRGCNRVCPGVIIGLYLVLGLRV